MRSHPFSLRRMRSGTGELRSSVAWQEAFVPSLAANFASLSASSRGECSGALLERARFDKTGLPHGNSDRPRV